MMLKAIRYTTLLAILVVVACARTGSESVDREGAPAAGAAPGDVPAYQSGKMHVHDPSDPSHSPGKNYQGGSADSIEAGKQHIHDPADTSHEAGKNYQGGSADALKAGKQHVHDPNDSSHSPGKNYQGGSADSIEAGKQHVHDPADKSHEAGKNLKMQTLPDAAADAKEYHTCPMHPEVRKAALGNCPTCGMRLVKKTAQ